MKHKVKRIQCVGGGGALRAGSRGPSRGCATGCDRQRVAPDADTVCLAENV
jgi:hypothetical protein